MNIKQNETAVFGGGCFWCTEAVFLQLRGVSKAEPGYAGGAQQNPSYEEVSSGTTGHIEVIRIEFDSALISYQDLLTVFFATHDPTTMNRQGADRGTQYASVIFYTSDAQRAEAVSFIASLTADETFDAPIVTQVRPFESFFEAEDYHKNYYERNADKPYCELVISPKIVKLHEKFERLLKKE